MSLVIANEHPCVGSPVRRSSMEKDGIKIEMKLLTEIFVPTIIIQLGFVIPSFLTASYIGRTFGYLYLDGYTLANLTGNLCTLSLLQGLYSASDTLSPQAFGIGNYREVGILAIRGFIACLMILIPINAIMIPFMEDILIAVGQDPSASRYAYHFYMVYALTFPFAALFTVTWKFLSTQNIMRPLVCAIVLSCALLPFLLRFCTAWFGYLGASLALVIFEIFASVPLVGYLAWRKPYMRATWPGLAAWREALDPTRFRRYMILGFGGMLASLEWLYWEALSLIVGTLGVVPLSVHTIPTQVLMVAFMPPLSLGIALSIRMGATLPVNVTLAKQLSVICFVIGVVVFGVAAIGLYLVRDRIFRFFTTERKVLDGCEEIWWHVCFYYFHLSIFGVNLGIATGLGMQWTLGIVTLVFLWMFGLPASYYFAVVQGKGLPAAWTWIWPPYVAINAVVMIAFVMTDWDVLAEKIRLHESTALNGADSEQLALHVNDDANGVVDETTPLRPGPKAEPAVSF